MLGREKMNGSEMRALWGSRIVIWITIILVLFPVVWIVMSSFSAGDSFFSVLSLSGKVQCGTLCDVVSGDGFYCMGMEFPKVLRYCGDDPACDHFSGGICIRETAFYREKIWTHVAAGAAGISQQYGSGRLLYSDL